MFVYLWIEVSQSVIQCWLLCNVFAAQQMSISILWLSDTDTKINYAPILLFISDRTSATKYTTDCENSKNENSGQFIHKNLLFLFSMMFLVGRFFYNENGMLSTSIYIYIYIHRPHYRSFIYIFALIEWGFSLSFLIVVGWCDSLYYLFPFLFINVFRSMLLSLLIPTTTVTFTFLCQFEFLLLKTAHTVARMCQIVRKNKCTTFSSLQRLSSSEHRFVCFLLFHLPVESSCEEQWMILRFSPSLFRRSTTTDVAMFGLCCHFTLTSWRCDVCVRFGRDTYRHQQIEKLEHFSQYE